MATQVFKEKDESLKNQWRNLVSSLDKGFVWDGIIDNDSWKNYDLKLLFIAREAYTRNADSLSEWNIAEAYNEDNGLFKVGKNANQATHNRIVEWAYAIDAALHNKKILNLESVKANDHSIAREVMMKSALINIKKIDGRTTSNLNDLLNTATRDKALLNAQIELINPNVILFCSSFQIVQEILFENATKIPGTKFCFEKDGKLLIDFLHPARCYANSYSDLFDDLTLIPNISKYLK